MTTSSKAASDITSAKTVLVTGATDGIGRQLALEFALRGWHVIVHGRSQQRAQAVQDSIQRLGEQTGARASVVLADLAEPEEVRRLAYEVARIAPSLHLLINNAGLGGTHERPRAHNSRGLESIMAVNAAAPYLLTQLLLPHMTAWGRVVNVASMGQEALNLADLNHMHDFDGVAAYCRSKVALIMATIDLAARAAAQQVTVNAVHPAHLMPTTMVQALEMQPIATLDDGVLPVLRVALDSELQDVTGQYFHRFEARQAHEQVYDRPARETVLAWLNTQIR